MANKDSATKSAQDVYGECLAGRLRLIGRVTAGIYEDALAPYGMTISQFNILTVVLRREPASPARIAERIRLEKSTLSRNLALMESAGWLRAEGRGRGKDLYVTPAGRKIYCEAVEGWRNAQTTLKNHLRDEGVDAVARLLSRLLPA